MPIAESLFKILVCPEDHSALHYASPPLLAALNKSIAAGNLKNRGGKPVTSPIDGGLVRADERYLYPIIDNIPMMLIDEGIPLGAFSAP